MPAFENMLGRKADGVVDFNDYNQTPKNAVLELNWALGCWQGNTKNVAMGIGLAYNGMTTAQIAGGAMDAQFAQMGSSLVSHGFSKAYIRLGWEMGGGWYNWGQKGQTFAAAWNHVYPILKKSCPTCTIIFNSADNMDASGEWPGTANMEMMGWDIYATSWMGGVNAEPTLWNQNYTGWWGVSSVGKGGWWGQYPVAVPEFGVGSRSDGHGACASGQSGKTVSSFWSACDDGYYVSQALTLFAKQNVSFIGFWDYNAGDYNSQFSDGSRPAEALAFVQAEGPPAVQAALKGAVISTDPLSATVRSSVANAPVHSVLAALPNGTHVLLFWGETPTKTNLTITLDEAKTLTMITAPSITWRAGSNASSPWTGFTGSLITLAIK